MHYLSFQDHPKTMNQIDCDQSDPETHIEVILTHYYFLLKGLYKPTLSPMHVFITRIKLIFQNARETRWTTKVTILKDGSNV